MSIPYPNVSGNIDGYVNHSNGKFHTNESVDDNMSRAFDFAGWNVWIDHNNYGLTGSSFANDGEGLLVQPHNGVEVFSFAYTNNFKHGGAGDAGYIAPYDADVIGMLQFKNINESGGKVGVVKQTPTNATEGHYIADVSVVENYDDVAMTTPADINGDEPSEQSNNLQDFQHFCFGQDPEAPKVMATYNKNKGVVRIEWVDSTNLEIGYRIDRAKNCSANEWQTIAYRPRQETDSMWTYPVKNRGDYGPNPHGCGGYALDFNEPAWHDYLIGGDSTYCYRVIALNCAEDTSINAKSTVDGLPARISQVVIVGKLNVYPNPAQNRVNFDYDAQDNGTAQIRIFDMSGKLIDFKEYPRSTGYPVTGYQRL